MPKLNENYLNLKASYLFSEIAHRTAAYKEANPCLLYTSHGEPAYYQYQKSLPGMSGQAFPSPSHIQTIPSGRMVSSVYEMDWEKLALTYRGVIFDIDNTLVPHEMCIRDRDLLLYRQQFCVQSRRTDSWPSD